MSIAVTISGKQSTVATPIGAPVLVAILGNDLTPPMIEYKNRIYPWNFDGSVDTSSFNTSPPREFANGYDAAVYYFQLFSSVYGNDYAAQKAALLASGFDWASGGFSVTVGFPSFPCVNGWGPIPSAAPLVPLCLGLAKNSSGSGQPYFIARYRQAQKSLYSTDGHGRIYPAGITLTRFILEVISSGTIADGLVIGTGADIDLPFPTTFLTDYNDLGNSLQECDYYFPIIGLTAAEWIAGPGAGFISFGTHTQVSA